MQENFAYGIRNPGLWNPEQSKEWNLESKFHWKDWNPESMEWDPESKNCLAFAYMGRQYWYVNGELLFFLYLHSTDQEPRFEDLC